MRISDRSSDVCSSDLFYAYRNLWTACLFTGPGFPQIDPEKEAKAARMLIEMNLETREELIAQRGRDIEDDLDEIASGSDMAGVPRARRATRRSRWNRRRDTRSRPCGAGPVSCCHRRPPSATRRAKHHPQPDPA